MAVITGPCPCKEWPECPVPKAIESAHSIEELLEVQSSYSWLGVSRATVSDGDVVAEIECEHRVQYIPWLRRTKYECDCDGDCACESDRRGRMGCGGACGGKCHK